jgi:hypothetical protein
VHSLIKGIGLVNCIYVNPGTNQYWVVDYRIFGPDGDGKTKLDHVHDIFINAVADKQLAFVTVLMDTWYATKEVMLLIKELGKTYCCPKTTGRWMTLPPRHRTAVLILCKGVRKNWSAARQSRLGNSQGAQGQTLAGRGVTTPHGLDCHQQSSPELDGCDTKGVPHSLEDRAVSPRAQTGYGYRALSMSKNKNSAHSHCVRHAGMESAHDGGSRARSNNLSD